MTALRERLRGRTGYFAASLAVVLSQYLVLGVVLTAIRKPPTSLPWWFWLTPFRALLGPALATPQLGLAVLAFGMLATLAVDAGLVFLAFQRAKRLGRGSWAAALTLVPVAQFAAIAWLAALSPRTVAAEPPQRVDAELDARTVALGLLIGVGMIVGAVALSTLVFGHYGYTLFLISPFLIAMVVGYLANRRGRVGFGRTVGLVALAFLLGAAALIGVAFEGLVCLVLAAPIIALVGLIGAALGSGLADLGRRGRRATLSGVAFIPLLLVAEAALPPRAAFDNVQSVTIAAPPAAVWDAVVRMAPMTDAPPPPFRWGLAYPVRAEILGVGVGAIRRSTFSTGEADERVTRWEPLRRLSAVVLSEPPAMRELSPYLHVNARHVSGYFRTTGVDFALAPLAGGRTRLTISSHHDLDLEPALYWAPLAQWAVRANTARVLAHFRRQAEVGGGGGGG